MSTKEYAAATAAMLLNLDPKSAALSNTSLCDYSTCFWFIFLTNSSALFPGTWNSWSAETFV